MMIATLALDFSEDKLADARAVMARVLDETRAFAGCEGVQVLVSADAPTRWLVVERWASKEADSEYRAWRAGDGAIKDLGPTLAGRPTLTYWESESAS